jgi:glycosyltransferase A (GT-A) superfamily protein (DUF2064 family)
MVMAKAPVAGRVKTRLTPVYSAVQAAALAEAALRDTLTVLAGIAGVRRVVVLDGAAGPWLPAGFAVVAQAGGGLDERLAAAFGGCDGPAVVVGMDTPQLTADLLRPALEPGGWDRADAWFGPAADGGFWALGLAVPDPALLRGVPMSRPDTGRLQRERLLAAGLTVRDLPELRDVDTPRDADLVAALAPGTRFAATLARIRAKPRAAAAPHIEDADNAEATADTADTADTAARTIAPGTASTPASAAAAHPGPASPAAPASVKAAR